MKDSIETDAVSSDNREYCPAIDILNVKNERSCDHIADGFICSNHTDVKLHWGDVAWKEAYDKCKLQSMDLLQKLPKIFEIRKLITTGQKKVSQTENYYFWIGLDRPDKKGRRCEVFNNGSISEVSCVEKHLFICIYLVDVAKEKGKMNISEAELDCSMKKQSIPMSTDKQSGGTNNETWINIRREKFPEWREYRSLEDIDKFNTTMQEIKHLGRVRPIGSNCLVFNGTNVTAVNCLYQNAVAICKSHPGHHSEKACSNCNASSCIKLGETCFRFYCNKQNWYKARDRCVEDDLHLLSSVPESLQHYLNFLYATYNMNCRRVWLAWHKEDWFSGDMPDFKVNPIPVTRWMKLTSMITPNANCARALWKKKEWKWEPTPCHHKHHVICTKISHNTKNGMKAREQTAFMKTVIISMVTAVAFILLLMLGLLVVCFIDSPCRIARRHGQIGQQNVQYTANPSAETRPISELLYEEIDTCTGNNDEVDSNERSIEPAITSLPNTTKQELAQSTNDVQVIDTCYENSKTFGGYMEPRCTQKKELLRKHKENDIYVNSGITPLNISKRLSLPFSSGEQTDSEITQTCRKSAP